MEIITVNNGSTDKSLKILKSFEKKYPDKVRVVSIEHHNYAGAGRNKGIDLARGKYIAFCDSDDEMPEDAIEKMYKVAVDSSADLTVAPHIVVEGRKRTVKNYHKSGISNGSIEEYLFKVEPSPWGKLFLKSFIEQIGKMPENFCFEDLAWYMVYITKLTRIAYCPYVGYVYYVRSGSQVHKRSNRILDTIKAEQYGLDNCASIHREYMEYYVAQRIKFNILHRSLYLKEWLEYLDSIWETLSQNTHVIHDIALYNFLEKQLNSLGDDR